MKLCIFTLSIHRTFCFGISEQEVGLPGTWGLKYDVNVQPFTNSEMFIIRRRVGKRKGHVMSHVLSLHQLQFPACSDLDSTSRSGSDRSETSSIRNWRTLTTNLFKIGKVNTIS